MRDSKPSNHCYCYSYCYSCRQNPHPSSSSLRDVPSYGLAEPSNWGFAHSALNHHPPSHPHIAYHSQAIDSNWVGVSDHHIRLWVVLGFDGFFFSLVCLLCHLSLHPIYVVAGWWSSPLSVHSKGWAIGPASLDLSSSLSNVDNLVWQHPSTDMLKCKIDGPIFKKY